jgi:hypothetical protein
MQRFASGLFSLSSNFFFKLEGSGRIRIQLVLVLLAYKNQLNVNSYPKPLLPSSLEKRKKGLVCKGWLATFSSFFFGCLKICIQFDMDVRG